jgi:hypothetical protein
MSRGGIASISNWQIILIGIVIFLSIAISIGIYSVLINAGFSQWWQIAIPICILWIFVILVVRWLWGYESTYD